MNAKDKTTASAFFVLFLLALISSWVWIADHAVIQKNTTRLDVIEELYHRSSDRWTGTDMRAWADELKRLNPGLKLPPIPIK